MSSVCVCVRVCGCCRHFRCTCGQKFVTKYLLESHTKKGASVEHKAEEGMGNEKDELCPLEGAGMTLTCRR